MSLNWYNKWKPGERDNLMAAWKRQSKTCILVQFSTLPFDPPRKSDMWYINATAEEEPIPVCLAPPPPSLCRWYCGKLPCRPNTFCHTSTLLLPTAFAFFFYNETEKQLPLCLLILIPMLHWARKKRKWEWESLRPKTYNVRKIYKFLIQWDSGRNVQLKFLPSLVS